MVATTLNPVSILVNQPKYSRQISSTEELLLDTKYAGSPLGSPRGSPTSSPASENPLEMSFPSMRSEPEAKNVFTVADCRRGAAANTSSVAGKLRGNIFSSRATAARPVRLGFRADLDQAQQLREVKAFKSTKASYQQMEDHLASTMDWCDTVAGCKWRLKMMIVDACAQRRALITKLKSEKAKKSAIPPALPLRHIMEDIDTFFHPVHLQKVGTPLKAYGNVKRQLLFKMDLYARGEGPAVKVDA